MPLAQITSTFNGCIIQKFSSVFFRYVSAEDPLWCTCNCHNTGHTASRVCELDPGGNIWHDPLGPLFWADGRVILTG